MSERRCMDCRVDPDPRGPSACAACRMIASSEIMSLRDLATRYFIELACKDPWTTYDVVDAGFGADHFRAYFAACPSNIVVPERWRDAEADAEPSGQYEGPEGVEPDSDTTLGVRR